jgi:hypothetical protein
MLTVIVVSGVVVGAIFAEKYLAQKKSWIPGMILPCLFAILLILGLIYRYSLPWLTLDNITPNSSNQELNYYMTKETTRMILSSSNVMLVFLTSLLYRYERRQKKQS